MSTPLTNESIAGVCRTLGRSEDPTDRVYQAIQQSCEIRSSQESQFDGSIKELVTTLQIDPNGVDKFVKALESQIPTALDEFDARARTPENLQKQQAKPDQRIEPSTAETVPKLPLDPTASPHFACYHLSPHGAELVNDTERQLTQVFNTGGNPSLTDESRVIIALAKLAAASHDIEQQSGKAVENEVFSAKAFQEYVRQALKTMGLDSPKYQQMVEFMGRELITNATYLAVNAKFTKRQPLLAMVNDVKMSEPNYAKNLPDSLRKLYTAATVISFYDTSRSLDEELLKQQKLYRQMTSCGPVAKVIDTAFAAMNITDPLHKEAFLIRIGQNMRMFLELNKFRKPPDALTEQECQQYASLFQEKTGLRNIGIGSIMDDNHRVQAEICRSLFEKFLKAIGGERTFAESLNLDDHLKLAIDLTGQNIFHVHKEGWQRHALDLTSLSEHYGKANTQPASATQPTFEDVRNIPSQTTALFLAPLLFYVAANQHGVKLAHDLRQTAQNNLDQKLESQASHRIS